MVLCNEMPQFLYAPQATLEEVTEADLLLHVLDASSPQVLQQRAAVLEVRRQGFLWQPIQLLPAEACRPCNVGALHACLAGATDWPQSSRPTLFRRCCESWASAKSGCSMP